MIYATTSKLNSFADQTGNLFVLDTRDIVDSKVVEKITTVEQLTKDQYQRFVTERLREKTQPLFDTIVTIWQPSLYKSDELNIASLTNNCSLFSCLYVSCH